MTKWLSKQVTSLLSPWGLLAGAALLALPFLVCHAAGLREFVSVLSGTSPATGASVEVMTLLGLVYAAFYMVFLILVPILVLAAGGLFMFSALAGGRQQPPANAGDRR